MKQRSIGNDFVGRLQVGEIGLGAMAFLQPAAKPRAQILATLRAALEAGITLIDTADAYGPVDAGSAGMGQNESLLGDVLDELGVKSQVVIATKGGHTRTDAGPWLLNSQPAYLRAAVDDSLKRLGVDQIDLYQHHRPDPEVDYADAMGTFKEIFDAGKVRMVGISNANTHQIRQAHEILGDALVSVQNQFAPGFRTSEPELALCQELGLAFLPWSPLGGIGRAATLNGESQAFNNVADELQVSPQQVCLAWMLAKSPVLIPIPGASRPESITDSAKASDLQLTPTQLTLLG
jgi:aryl-alcohol dehydrogenase-like predicted oxidoreductase